MGNTFSFDASEFSDSESEADAADEAIADLEASPEAEDPELFDVDRRLETADYYRAILKHEFFDAQSPAAEIVDREIRTFIRERLEVLLGLRSPNEPTVQQVESPFDEDEVQALKLLASKVLKKPSLVASEPVVKKMTAPPVTRPEIRLTKVTPQAKKIPAPPPAPSTKPRAKPGPKPGFKRSAPVEAGLRGTPGGGSGMTVTGAAGAAKPKTASAAPSQESRVVDRSIENPESQTFVNYEGKSVTLVEGETIEENGRRYKIDRNERGTLYRRDITGQVTSPNRLPPMTIAQMSAMSQQWSEQNIASQDDKTGQAILAVLQEG